ncbi:MAG TPA: hypothetical protein VMB18_01580 [Terriglobales bacterium]|nr:hypothetical protein [Terriglobales bacterium]
MRIDDTHRKWFIGSVAALLVATIVYIPYVRSSPQGPDGRSAMGLIYGSVGSAFMLFAGLLGARKKKPIWRVGRAQSWMRGHLWLGTLSFPIILFHSGFHFGVGLTRFLMWLFVIVFISGICGAVLQHYMPRVTTQRVPMETIYEQIGSVREQLVKEASAIVEETSAALLGSVEEASELQRATAASAGTMGGLTVASGLQVDESANNELREFFGREMEPFLNAAGSRGLALGNRDRSRSMFQQLRLMLPPNLHSAVDDLENICEEKRELDQQTRYHRILHGWLLVHIPFSYAVLLLGAIHAVTALKY